MEEIYRDEEQEFLRGIPCHLLWLVEDVFVGHFTAGIKELRVEN
ncbi:hypothetical protein [Thermococcus sp.]